MPVRERQHVAREGIAFMHRVMGVDHERATPGLECRERMGTRCVRRLIRTRRRLRVHVDQSVHDGTEQVFNHRRFRVVDRCCIQIRRGAMKCGLDVLLEMEQIG